MKKLSNLQKQIICYLYNNHSPFSINMLAEAFDCTRQTIYNIIKKNNTLANDNKNNVKLNDIIINDDSKNNVVINETLINNIPLNSILANIINNIK